jgi:hypothetical protein
LTPTGAGVAELEAWSARRRKLFGFAPDPAMPFYPFHPESRNTMVADCRVTPEGTIDAGFVPCWIDDLGRPVPAAQADGGDEIAAYVERITSEAGFDTTFTWDGERVAVTAEAATQASGSVSGP